MSYSVLSQCAPQTGHRTALVPFNVLTGNTKGQNGVVEFLMKETWKDQIADKSNKYIRPGSQPA